MEWKTIEALDHDEDVLMRCKTWGVVVAAKIGNQYVHGFEQLLHRAGMESTEFCPFEWCEIPQHKPPP